MRQRPNPQAVIAIIVLNIIVFLMWRADFGGPSFMPKNFLVSWSAISQGRFWTVLTSVFSHNAAFHIFINMFVLWNFGPILEMNLGATKFVGFYLVTGIVASISHSLTSAFILGQPSLPALGASGSVAGVILVFALLYPKEKLLLFGIIPMPALVGALAFVAIDLWGLVAQSQGGGFPIGHGAHLGGALTGLIFYLLFLRPSSSRRPFRG